MNGRIYDPTLGRFLQADPHIQAPSNSQSYNRYSYVLNNPLSYTDPSGYFFKKLFKAIADIPILNAVISVAFAIYCQACLVAYNAMTTYALTGSLKAAFTSGIATAIMPGGGSVGNVLASAVIGGVSSRLQGGNFGHGFWSAGVGAAMGGATKGIKNPVGKVLASAVVGGTISKITGGKFANGAYSAAFAAALTADWSQKVNPKDAAYAQLSGNAYRVGAEENPLVKGDMVGDYKVVDTIDSESDSGLKAALYVDKSGNHVLAFAGTESLVDWKTNLLQGLGIQTAQYTDAIALAQGYKADFGSITLTGHSLGGGLASAAAIHTNSRAVVFNAAGVHNNTLGDFSRTRGSITHYHSGYDAISAINAFTLVSVPGAQMNLGHASWHDMGSMCRVMGTSC